MKDKTKSILGWFLVIAPIPTIVLTLSLYAVFSFIIATSSTYTPETTGTLIRVVFSFTGIFGILGVFFGIPIGIYLLLSRTPKTLDAIPTAPTKQQKEYRSASVFAKVTVAFLIAFSITASINVIFQGATIGYLLSNLHNATHPKFTYILGYNYFEPLVLLLFLASAFTFLRWKYRTYRNAMIKSQTMRYSHHWTIAGYFVPFANIIIPFRTMKDLALTHKADVASQLLMVWWIAFLFAQVVLLLTPEHGLPAVAQDLWYASSQLIWDASLTVSAVALIFIIKEITANQETHFTQKN